MLSAHRLLSAISRGFLNHRPAAQSALLVTYYFLPKRHLWIAAPNGRGFRAIQTRFVSTASDAAPAAPSAPAVAAEAKKLRKFSVNGAFEPIMESDKYMIDWKKNPDDVQNKILDNMKEYKLFSVMYGPRSSTKSSRAKFAIAKLLEEDKYIPIYMSFGSFGGGGKVDSNAFWKEFSKKFLIAAEGKYDVDKMPRIPKSGIHCWFEGLFAKDRVFKKPVVLVFDEFDTLLGDDQVKGKQSFLNTLREIKHMDRSMIQSVMLIGTFDLFNVSDGASVTKNMNPCGINRPKGSPFNVADFFPVGNFTEQQCNQLLDQMEEDREIQIDNGIRQSIWAMTKGHAGAFCFIGMYIQQNPDAACSLSDFLNRRSAIIKGYAGTSNIRRIVEAFHERPGLYNKWALLESQKSLRADDYAHSLAAIGALVKIEDGKFHATSDLLHEAVNFHFRNPSPEVISIEGLAEITEPAAFGVKLISAGLDPKYLREILKRHRSFLANSVRTLVKTVAFPAAFKGRSMPSEAAYRCGPDIILTNAFAEKKEAPMVVEQPIQTSKPGRPQAIDSLVPGRFAIEYCAHVAPNNIRKHAVDLLAKTLELGESAQPILIAFVLTNDGESFPEIESIATSMTAEDFTQENVAPVNLTVLYVFHDLNIDTINIFQQLISFDGKVWTSSAIELANK